MESHRDRQGLSPTETGKEDLLWGTQGSSAPSPPTGPAGERVCGHSRWWLRGDPPPVGVPTPN